MIYFVKGSELSQSIEEMIANADKFLWLISPYIKLSGRIKDDLSRIRKKDKVQIVVVYGKNENDKTKSISQEDFDFFKEFPNIKICYVKNLHAKYYASEDFRLLCSMNLYEFSQNTNIEAGIRIHPKDLISGAISNTISSSEPELDAHKYFEEIVACAEIEFLKQPNYKKGLMSSSYIDSSIIIDNTKSKSNTSTIQTKNFHQNEVNQNKFISMANNFNQPTMGYCIRTGVRIPFDLSRPLCYDSYKSWVQFQNPDFPEKYCHSTGKPSYGKTSMRNPILN